ncbi:hypothetical protein [Paenibacillus alba]|uniref:Uncharacterized protein n=1 Tax=Paenibacillus alba TaxID=1197127 RepID=A0ABU6GEU0_9BACL|nr:hypothetical protein [Paenibacillus alba]MEC0231189.1 hypothetical protein [Paenibacillus alba]
MSTPLRFELIVDYCIWEHVPKEQSRTYRNMFILFGEAYADQYTYERGADYDAPDRTVGVHLGAPGQSHTERHITATAT